MESVERVVLLGSAVVGEVDMEVSEASSSLSMPRSAGFLWVGKAVESMEAGGRGSWQR